MIVFTFFTVLSKNYLRYIVIRFHQHFTCCGSVDTFNTYQIQDLLNLILTTNSSSLLWINHKETGWSCRIRLLSFLREKWNSSVLESDTWEKKNRKETKDNSLLCEIWWVIRGNSLGRQRSSIFYLARKHKLLVMLWAIHPLMCFLHQFLSICSWCFDTLFITVMYFHAIFI